MEANIRRLAKLVQTDKSDGDKFLKNSKPEFVDFMCHMIHTFKKYHPQELKAHFRKILSSKTARQAKGRMRNAHEETGGGFFDSVKSFGNSALGMAKDFGSSALSTAGSWFDKGKDLASKGFDMAKPYIKQYAPDAVAMGTSFIPVAGPIIAPFARKATAFGLSKLF